MKVYEKINQLKNTNATLEKIAEWGYMNKICPVDFREGLELEYEYPQELEDIAFKCCSKFECNGCMESFLNSDIEGE